MNIEALQTKYPIIDWEVYTEDSRMYWKIIQVGNHTKVELKRLFKPDADDELWKSQKHIHDITWRLYNTCGVHHVSTKDGMDIYMLVEREYPLSRGVPIQMLVAKLLVEQDNEMSRELLRKILIIDLKLGSIANDDDETKPETHTESTKDFATLEDLADETAKDLYDSDMFSVRSVSDGYVEDSFINDDSKDYYDTDEDI
ncbi:hypothetical protein Tco_1246057 [Tanacetum coccineum]